MVHPRYPAFAVGLPEAIGLVPGVISGDVVAQETDHEHETCLPETVARCKMESPPRVFAAALWENSEERCR